MRWLEVRSPRWSKFEKFIDCQPCDNIDYCEVVRYPSTDHLGIRDSTIAFVSLISLESPPPGELTNGRANQRPGFSLGVMIGKIELSGGVKLL